MARGFAELLAEKPVFVNWECGALRRACARPASRWCTWTGHPPAGGDPEVAEILDE